MTNTAPENGPEVEVSTEAETATEPTTANPFADELAQAKAEAAKWKSMSRKTEDQAKATRSELESMRPILEQLAKAQGIDMDGKPDADKLSQQLQAANEAQRQAAVELAVLRQASGLNANADALLDSRAFMHQIADLDPSAPDFAEQVAEAVKASVESNSRYQAAAKQPEKPQRTAPPVKSSGADFSGAPTGERQWTDADVSAASPKQLEAAIEKGLLRDYGISPKRGRR